MKQVKEDEEQNFKAENKRREISGEELLVKDPKEDEERPLIKQQEEQFDKIAQVIYDSSYDFDLDMFSS